MTRKPLVAAAAAAFGLGLGAAQADVYVYTPVPADTPTTTYYYTAPAGPSITHQGQSPDDQNKAEDIAYKMQADGGFEGASIDIVVFRGEAHLRGTVRDDVQSQRAATIAAMYVGHKQVVNDLRVTG